MDIADMLELSDLMSFQSTCRHIGKQVSRSVEAAKKALVIGFEGEARIHQISHMYNSYFCRLKKDRFAELAEFEKVGEASKNAKLLCSWCTDFHPAAEFHTEQVAKPANERVCIGATAKL